MPSQPRNALAGIRDAARTSHAKEARDRAPTKIGNSCFIGPGAIITKGVTVGDHVMIAANAVVTGDVPSYAFVRGNPAVRVGRVVVASDGSVRIEAMEGKDAER